MRDLYLDKIVDITDSKCQFINEFNREIHKYGAVVYNFESNSYQFIRQFDQIDFKKELLPDFIKVENASNMLNGLQISVHYEFDPETEEDEENLDIWNSELSKIELAVLGYDEDGEANVQKYIPLSNDVSKHVIWFLNRESYDYILDTDFLLLSPVIKNLNIARDLIRKYAVHPFKFEYDPKDQDDYQIPELYGVFGQDTEQ